MSIKVIYVYYKKFGKYRIELKKAKQISHDPTSHTENVAYILVVS